jgi:competence protein ComEC
MRATFRDVVTRAPMLRLALFFLLGVLLGPVVRFPWIATGAVAVLLFALWCWVSYGVRSYERRWMRGALLIPVLVTFGMFWQDVSEGRERPNSISTVRTQALGWDATITEVISTSERTMRAWADTRAALDSSGAHVVHGKLLLTLLVDSTSIVAVGDELLVMAKADSIDRIPDPGGFDQRSWAGSFGVYHQCFAGLGSWRVLHHRGGWTTYFEGWRKRITLWLRNSSLKDRERGMVKAILLGVRDELDTDQKSAFARSGTMHVLAVSGSHVALIYGVLLFAFRRFGEVRRTRIIRSLVILVVLWFYAGLTGATPSVLRATVTFTLFCFSDMLDRRTEAVNSLAGAAFLLVLWDPQMIWQLSFQLSFLAVLGIALFYGPLVHLWSPPNIVLGYFWSLISVSIAAQTLTTPLALLAFKAFPVWFLPANMVIVGLVALGVYGGALLLLFHKVPYLGEVITWLMQGLLRAIGIVSDFFAYLPGAYPGVRINEWQCAAMYAGVLFLAAWFFERWHWARIATISVIVLLLFSWGWKAHEQNSTPCFAIYDDRNGLTCAVGSGRSLTIFADSVDEWTTRKIAQHERVMGASNVGTVFRIPERIHIGATNALLIDAGWKPPDSTSFTPPTVVVLTSDGRYDIAALNDRLHPRDGFVLAATLKAKGRAYLRRWCMEHNVPVHDVRLAGAYVR